MRYKLFVIDFDGTIVDSQFHEIIGLKPHAKRVINRIYENGGEIGIWTCRTEEYLQACKEYLDMNGIKYHCINETLPTVRGQWGEDGRKIWGHVYIDDGGIYAHMNNGIDWLQIEEWIFEGENDNVS